MAVSMNIHDAKPTLVSEAPKNSNALTVNFGAITITLFFEDDEIEKWWCLRNALQRSDSASYWDGERRILHGLEAEKLAGKHYETVKDRLASQLEAAQ